MEDDGDSQALSWNGGKYEQGETKLAQHQKRNVMVTTVAGKVADMVALFEKRCQ